MSNHTRGFSLQFNPVNEFNALKKKEQLAQNLENIVPEEEEEPSRKSHHRHLPTKLEIMQYLEELDKEDEEIQVLKTEPPENIGRESIEIKEGDIERQIQSVELLLEEYKDSMISIEPKKKPKINTKKQRKLQYACEETLISGTYGGDNSRSLMIKTDNNVYLQLPKKIINTEIQEGNRIRLKLYRNRELENDREIGLLTIQKQLLKETSTINKNI